MKIRAVTAIASLLLFTGVLGASTRQARSPALTCGKPFPGYQANGADHTRRSLNQIRREHCTSLLSIRSLSLVISNVASTVQRTSSHDALSDWHACTEIPLARAPSEARKRSQAPRVVANPPSATHPLPCSQPHSLASTIA